MHRIFPAVVINVKKYLYFISAGHLSVDVANGALPAILPFLVMHRGMSYTEVAGLIFASAFLSSILQPFFGWLADRVSNHWFMGAGIILAGVSLAAAGFVESYFAIFAAVSIMGAGSSMFHPEAARLVNLISGEHKGEGMAIFSVGGNAGFGAAPILAVAMLSIFELQGLIIFGIIGLVMGVATLILVPRIISAGKAERRSVKKISGGVNDWSAFKKLTVILVGRSTIFSCMMAFLPLYCIANLSVTNATAGALLSLYAVFGILMTMLGGKLADHFDLVSVIRVCTIFYVPTIALIILAPKFILVAALIVPLAFATHGSYSPFVVLGQMYLAKNIGFASGVTLGLSTSLGGIIAPILGIFADNFGLQFAMYLLLAIGTICAGSSFLLTRPKKIHGSTSK